MEKITKMSCVVLALALCGCSEGNDSIKDKVKGLLSSDKQSVPDIVKEQQRREKIRQNTMWTEENQALHPLEYCQAQLSAVSKYEDDLLVLTFSIKKMMVRNEKQEEDDGVKVKRYKESFTKMKSLYLSADGNGEWPVEYNGISLSKDRLEDAIIDLDAEIQRLTIDLPNVKQRNIVLEKKLVRVQSEQKALVELKRKISDTILSLKEKKVVGETSSIRDALAAINASIGAINVDGGISIDDLVEERPEEVRKRKFHDIISR